MKMTVAVDSWVLTLSQLSFFSTDQLPIKLVRAQISQFLFVFWWEKVNVNRLKIWKCLCTYLIWKSTQHKQMKNFTFHEFFSQNKQSFILFSEDELSPGNISGNFTDKTHCWSFFPHFISLHTVVLYFSRLILQHKNSF